MAESIMGAMQRPSVELMRFIPVDGLLVVQCEGREIWRGKTAEDYCLWVRDLLRERDALLEAYDTLSILNDALMVENEIIKYPHQPRVLTPAESEAVTRQGITAVYSDDVTATPLPAAERQG